MNCTKLFFLGQTNIVKEFICIRGAMAIRIVYFLFIGRLEIRTIFKSGIEKSDDIFRRNVKLYVMSAAKYVSGV